MSLLLLNTKHRSAAAGVVVQHAKLFKDNSGSAQGTLSGTITGVTAGNTLVVLMGNYNFNTASACSDGQGSYTLDKDSGFHNTLERGYCFHLANANSGSHTISVTNCGNYPLCWAVEITAPTVSPFDVGSTANSGFGLGTDGFSSGNFTTSQANDLILGFCMVTTAAPPTVGTGFTSIDSDSNFPDARIEYKAAGAAGTYAATFTNAAGAAGVVVGVAFKHP